MIELSELTEFHSLLKCGASVGDFIKKYNAVIAAIPRELDKEFRAWKQPFDTLQKEIRPMSYFARTELKADDVVRFSLNSDPDDCFVTRQGKIIYTIQITLSRAREHVEIMSHLNKSGSAPGLINLSNKAPSQAYKSKFSRQRISYSRKEQMAGFITGITEAIEGKKFVSGGDVLIVDAPQYHLANSDLTEFLPQLSDIANAAPFKKVALVGTAPESPFCRWLKGKPLPN